MNTVKPQIKIKTPTAIVFIVQAVGNGDSNFVIVYGSPSDVKFGPTIEIRFVK